MLIGVTVPNFKAETTKGPVQFYDWQADSWVVLFSHPADFTLVCITDIKSYCLDIPSDFPYPIIADPTRELAVSFGILDEDQRKDPEIGKTIRTLFIISPDHKVRLTMFYPMTCGRNVDEILRVIDSMQLTDRLKVVATKAMIVPSITDAEAEKLFPKGFDKVNMPSGVNYVRTTENY